MSEPSVRTRKRDKILHRLRLWSHRPASPSNPQISNAGAASNIHPLHEQTLPSTPAPSIPLSGNVASTTTAAPNQTVPPGSSTPTPTPSPSPPAVDLWPAALQKLSEDEQKIIQGISPIESTQRPFSDGIDGLVAIIKDKQRECEEKSYKFSFRGHELILRDVAQKTVFWLNKFKQVGDVAVSYDPVHAALPWAGVRFLLQASVAGHEQMGALLLSVEKVTYLINRCTIYESLYRSETTPPDALRNFHAALIELYTAILHLMAIACRLFAKTTKAQTLHAVFNPDELSGYISKCEDLEERVEREAHNCDREIDAKTRKLLESLRTPIFRTDERVSSLPEKVDGEEHLKTLEWISKAPYGTHHNTVKEKRTQDTCEWLLRHNRYLEWKDTSSSVALWLCGNPGTGKTNLTSKVIDEIQDALEKNPNHEGLAFFYCNRNESDRREPLSVLRSFVRQLSTIANNEDSIQKGLREFCIQTRKKGSEPTMGDCKDRILESINLYPKTTLILDALDECDQHKRRELMEIFDDFVARASRPVKIFISSRPESDIREKFKSRANIEIQAADNQDDISRFVQSEITKHQRWNKFPPRLQKDVVETLQLRSQGMFQWAYLQIKQLLDLHQEKPIRDRLGKLPEGLKATYDEIYGGMNDTDKQIADRAFRWVMCACTPLSTNELLQAVCQDEDDDTIKYPPEEGLDEDLLLQYCHNLLVIDPIRKVWIPSHLSVIEYFENHLWSQTKANCFVSTVCLSLLNSTTSDDLEDELEEYSIRSYSFDDDEDGNLSIYVRHHWMIHVQKCKEDYNDRLSTLLKRFLGSPTDSSPAYQSWHEMFPKYGYYVPHSSFLRSSSVQLSDFEPASSASFAICAFGFYTILSSWWDNPWPEHLHKNKKGRSLLQLAVEARSVSICRRLIEWGAEVNEQLEVRYYGSILAAAASTGEKEVVELLIKSGAEVNAQLQVGDYGSALAAASSKGEKEVVELLIKSRAEVNAQLQFGAYGSALAAASFMGEKEVVDLLIKFGADVNTQVQVGEFGSALAAASCRGEKEVVELLIKSGAEVNAQLQVGLYGSALAAASYWGEKEVVELLIKSGVEVNAQVQVGYYGSALVAASSGGKKEVVELLIKSGADVNAQLQFGEFGSALAAASYTGEKEVVELLIKSRAEVNIQLQFGRYGNALVAAVSAIRGRKSVVELLIKSGAEVNTQLQVGEFGSALTAANRSGNEDIIQILIEHGAKVDTP